MPRAPDQSNGAGFWYRASGAAISGLAGSGEDDFDTVTALVFGLVEGVIHLLEQRF